MEANEGYWRKMPSVKRLVFKSVPEPTTRLAMLKRGEVDVAYLLDAPQAAGGQARPQPQAGLLRRHRHLLPRLPRPVGPEVAVGRPARAAGRELRHRPPGAERGGDARRLQAGRQPRAARPSSSRCRSSRYPYDPGEGQAAPGRGRLSQRLRRRRAAPAAAVLLAGRGDRRLPRRRWASRLQDAADGARRLLRGAVQSKKAQGRLRLQQRALRQRRLAAVGGRSRATAPTPTAAIPTSTRSSSSRRARPTGRSARRCCTRSSSSCYERVRFGPIFEYIWPSGIGPRVAEPGADADQPLSVVGAAGGGPAQEELKPGRHDGQRRDRPHRQEKAE